ncbi:MAG: YqjD family protein [Oligoflexales bacterium]
MATVSNKDLSSSARSVNIPDGNLAEKASDIAEDVSSRARSATSRVQQRLDDARGWFRGVKNQTQDEIYPAAERTIRENPMKAILISAGVGILLGLIFRPARD